MANELIVTAGFDYSKSGLTVYSRENVSVTVTGTEISRHIQSIGTSAEEAVAVSDIGTQGYVFAKNLDSTNYVEMGTTGKLAVKLKAGEIAVFRTGGALYAQANTAAVRVLFIVIED